MSHSFSSVPNRIALGRLTVRDAGLDAEMAELAV